MPTVSRIPRVPGRGALSRVFHSLERVIVMTCPVIASGPTPYVPSMQTGTSEYQMQSGRQETRRIKVEYAKKLLYELS
jgi:hypothetical protein